MRVRPASCPRSSPTPEIARATFDKYEAHLLLERLGLPSPPTVLPGRADAVLPGDGQAAQGLGRALDPPRRGCGRGGVHGRLHRRAGDGPEADGRAGVLDRRAVRSRRPLPQRDPAHDDRVAWRRVDQGHRDRRSGADRARPPRGRGARRPWPVHRSGVPRQRGRARDHRRQHALRRRVPGADVRGAAGPDVSGADRRDGARRADRAPRRRVPGRGQLHALLLAARARLSELQPDRARHRQPARSPAAPGRAGAANPLGEPGAAVGRGVAARRGGSRTRGAVRADRRQSRVPRRGSCRGPPEQTFADTRAYLDCNQRVQLASNDGFECAIVATAGSSDGRLPRRQLARPVDHHRLLARGRRTGPWRR